MYFAIIFAENIFFQLFVHDIYPEQSRICCDFLNNFC